MLLFYRINAFSVFGCLTQFVELRKYYFAYLSLDSVTLPAIETRKSVGLSFQIIN